MIQDTSMVLGSFTVQNNKEHGRFASAPTQGDESILEYYEPENVDQLGRIRISRVVHAYKDLFAYVSGFGDSDTCENNVYCPEGEPWADEIRSVALILLDDGTRLCSGAIVNNVEQDLTPFFLTANHCNLGDINTWVFWFNYESCDCNNPTSEPSTQTTSGATYRASNSASDFLLIELNEIPPTHYNVHYAGWSNLNSVPSWSVGIHHPQADIKKISFENDPATEHTWGTPSNNHWQVIFDDGTVEPGSSGSPLFSPNHRIVGQLHGGSGYPYCSQSHKAWYGKLSLSWDHGGTSSSRLKDWLDPNNTGATYVDGTGGYQNFSGTISSNTSWAGGVFVIGDLTIDSGVTLTIESGTEILFASFPRCGDNGQFPNKCDIVVNGSLVSCHTCIVA